MASWWLWRAKSGNFSPNSVRCEKVAVDNLRRTALAGMRMDGIAPSDCRDALLWLRAHPRKGSEYSPTSMAKFHQVLNAVLQQAAAVPMAR